MFNAFFTFLYGLVIGGVIMFFVYHNNAKKFSNLVEKTDLLSDKVKAELEKIGIKL